MNTEKDNDTWHSKSPSSYEYQEKTFNAIKKMGNRIQGLAFYLQCDFEEMLDDGTTTKEKINLAIDDMDKSFDKVIAELNQLREQTRDILKHHGS